MVVSSSLTLWQRTSGVGTRFETPPSSTPSRDKSRGFSPEAIVAQFVFSFCSGGISLSDAGRLGTDKALGRLVGMDRWADGDTGVPGVGGVGREASSKHIPTSATGMRRFALEIGCWGGKFHGSQALTMDV